MLRTKTASRVIAPSRLPAATLMLLAGNIVWMVVFGLKSYEFEGVTATELGFSCGLLACAIAVWAVLGRARKITALLVWTLVSIAVVLTGPLVASILMFSIINGCGGLYAMIALKDEPGLEGIGLMVSMMLVVATVSVLCFTSQAWAVLVARAAWKRR